MKLIGIYIMCIQIYSGSIVNSIKVSNKDMKLSTTKTILLEFGLVNNDGKPLHLTRQNRVRCCYTEL